MRTRRLRVLVALLLVTLAAVTLRRLSFDPAPWQEDYRLLREHLTATYANLEWAVDGRGLDLAALDAATRDRLARCRSNIECAWALADFLAAFDDGHLRLDLGGMPVALAAVLPRRGSGQPARENSKMSEGSSEPPPWPAETTAAEACDRLGMHDDRDGFELATASLPSWQEARRDPFPAGRFSLPDGRVVGLVRIPIFDQRRYRAACEEAWTRREAAACDQGCQRAFRWRGSANHLLDELRATIEALAGVDVMVVDLTGNGGGTDWVDAAARMFTASPLVCPRLGAIRHEHWRGRPARALEAIERALAAELAAPDRALLTDARARLQLWRDELEGSCDLTPLWRGEAPGCSRLTRAPVTACGPLERVPPDALTGVDEDARDVVFEGLSFRYAEGVWRGPLFVLVDRRTGSASEHFAAMLQDGDAATIIGEATAGSGCGYTGGGTPITLPHSGFTVRVPDCTRWRADGVNELEGVTPDRAIDWSGLGAKARADAVVDALQSR